MATDTAVIEQTLCRMCDDRCGIDVRMEDGRVVDIRGNPDHPWSHGRLCAKARAAVDTVNHPDRLLRPLKRTGDGWEELPLEQALDEIADLLRGIIDRDGARSVSVWKGEAVGFAQQEDLARRFIHKSLSSTLEEMLDYEAVASTMSAATQDAREGTQSFLEKRKPIFRGH